MPLSCGIFHPAILLPSDAAGWSEQKRRMVLLHEAARIRRRDPATHLTARIALAFYWWNPLTWFAWRAFLKEREQAADDLVLAAGARASEYAAHLLEIARALRFAPAVGWAAVAMARRSRFEGRLISILDPRIKRNDAGLKSICAAALVSIVLITPFAAVRAQDDARLVPADVGAIIRAAAAQKNYQMLEAAAGAAIVFDKYDLAQKIVGVVSRYPRGGGGAGWCGIWHRPDQTG